MFGIGPFEFLVIAAIALVVIGPEKVPEFARVAMKTITDIRTYVGEAKRDIEREMRPVQREFNKFSKVDAKDYLERMVAEDEKDEENREEDTTAESDTPFDGTDADEAQDDNMNPTGAEPFMDPESDPSIHGGYNMEPAEPDWTENIGDAPDEDDASEEAPKQEAITPSPAPITEYDFDLPQHPTEEDDQK